MKLEDMAWGNGLKLEAIPHTTSALVKEMKVNPNWYTALIEHEGYDGHLTSAQLDATVWLQKHIKDEVKRIWGHEIEFDRKHILGHF